VVKIALFCHSLLSDWNNGNAHFLRGLTSELVARGHAVRVFEAADAWSVRGLRDSQGDLQLEQLRKHYPKLDIERYDSQRLDLDWMTEGASLVLVHEWNEPELVKRLGEHRGAGAKRYKLLFHDTHHRSVSQPNALGGLDLSRYDGVLAFGETVRERYLRAGWADRVWTFHEAADIRVFRPFPDVQPTRDVVWVGNYGDGERTAELEEFLLGPARALKLSGTVHGVRYPAEGVEAVERANLTYGGWLANYDVPRSFADHQLTVHIPRRPYVTALPGIPTIRVFEALACGIPLISAPWLDSERLFHARDFVRVRNGAEMQRAMRMLLNEPAASTEIAIHGRETVLTRHTCAHRADELLAIVRRLGVQSEPLREQRTSLSEGSRWD
jgi:spore maturation protein CgeB